MNWVRARSDDQIEQRLSEIIDATARLYEKNRFEDISFATIAKEANFTRSNLYRYFETKEEIFLELIKYDITNWRKDILETFAAYQFTSAQAFAKTWVDLSMKHQRMTKLFTILYTLLEEKSSLEALTAFKKKVMEELGMVAEFLSKALPFPSIEAATNFLLVQLSLSIGAYPMIDLTEKQRIAMNNVGMVSDPQYFKDIFISAITYMLEGLIKKQTDLL